MNKIIFYISLTFITGLIACNNDEITSEQADSFVKLYGSWNVDLGSDVKEFNNSYLILATVTSVKNNELTDIALIKTDKFGNTESIDTLTSASGGTNTAGKILLSDDGGFIVLGTYEDTANNNTDLFLRKYDSGLNTEWEKSIGSSSNEKAGAIKKLATGYIIAGSTTRESLVNGNQEGKWDITLTKIDNSGNIEWENSFGGSGDDISNDIVVKSDKYLIVGTTNSFHEQGQAGQNIIAIETNLQGNETDKLTYGGSYNDYGNSVIKTNTGYVIVGTSEIVSGNNSNIIIINIDNNIHNIIWNQSYGTTLNDKGFDIIETNDGYVTVGSKEQTTGIAAYFMRVDFDGNILYENSYGGYNNQVIYSIENTSDNNFIMVGSSGYDGNDMICLIKVNAEGEL